MAVTIREYCADDAPGIADLWRASDESWPGGLTGGAPVTAEKVREREGRDTYEAFLVAEDDGRIVGYWKVKASPDRKALYGDFINVHPAYHGRGIGKAFQMKFLELALARGFERMELNTWAGNLKAVPLYKRTGFFWLPDTSVEMRSYLPQILRLPGAARFFERFDWYATLDRPIEVAPDDERWEGVHAFRYRWHADGEVIEAIADPRSDGLTAYEDSQLAVACVLGKEELVGGVPHDFQLRLRNKTETPRQVTLFVEGDEGSAFSAVQTLTLEDEQVLPFTLTPVSDLPTEPPGRRGYTLTTRAVIGDQALTLRTGFRLQQPVTVAWARPQPVLRPGGASGHTLVVINHLDEPVTGEIEFPATEGLQVTPARQAVAIAARGRVSVPLTIIAAAAGGFVLRPRVVWRRDGHEVVTRRFPLALHFAAPDQPTVSLDEEWLVLRNDWLVVENRRSGDRWEHSMVTLRSAGDGAELARFPLPSAGPPFEDRAGAPAPVVRAGTGEHTAWAEFELQGRAQPEMRLACRLTLGAEPIVRADYTVLGTAAANPPLIQQFLQQSWEDAPSGRATVVPLCGGPVGRRGSPVADFPSGEGDLPREPATYDEGWIAWEGSDGTTLGWLFGPVAERTTRRLVLRAEERVEPGVARTQPAYLFLLPGDHRAAARLWRRLFAPDAPGPRPLLPVFDLAAEPPLPVSASGAWDFVVRVAHRRERPVNERVTFEPPAGVMVEPATLVIENAARETPSEHRVRAVTTGPPGVVVVPARVETEVFSDTPALTLWRAGDAADSVQIREDEDSLWVENSRVRARVSPAFRASVSAFEAFGSNHLHSAYPTTRAWSWINPWFGGIVPELGEWGEQPLLRQAFTAEPIEQTGSQGLLWRGVRLRADLEHKNYRGLRLELDYLMTPGGLTLALVYRLINRTDGHWHGLPATLECFTAVSGNIEGTRGFVEDDRVRHRVAGDYDADFGHTTGWVVLENPQTGHFLTLTSGSPDWRVSVYDWGKGYGIHPFLSTLRCALAPGESREFLALLTAGDDRDAAFAARHLTRLTALP